MIKPKSTPLASRIRTKLVSAAEDQVASGEWYCAYEMTEAIAQLARHAGASDVTVTRDADGSWSITAKGPRGEKIINARGRGGPRPTGQPLPAHIREAVIERDGKVCAYCGEEGGPLHIDHILATARGGTDELDNLCVACAACNMSKGDRLVEEWFTNKFKRDLIWARKGYGKPWVTRVDRSTLRKVGDHNDPHVWRAR